MNDQQRAAFEAWISKPPFEKPLERNPDGSGFPGQYRAYEVQLALEAYQAALASTEVQVLRAVSEEYSDLIRHMDAGGDFFEFIAKRAALAALGVAR